jgi:hypothetical protein
MVNVLSTNAILYLDMKKFFTSRSPLFNVILGGIMLIAGVAVSIVYWQIVLVALIVCLIAFGMVRSVQRYNRWIVWKATQGTRPFPRSSWFGIRFSLVNIVLSVMLVMSIAASIVHVTHATAPNPGHNFTEVGGGILQGQLIYGSAADTFSALSPSAVATNYLSNTGTSNNPAWAQVNLTNGVTGALPPANGGTGIANGGNNTITFTGNYTIGITLSAATALTFPTSGTVTALGNATTGSGNIVLATSPVLTSPTLGAASVTTINGLTPTSQSTGFTLTGGTTPATLTITGSATISGTPLASPMTTVGDIIYGAGGGAATRLAAGATTGMILMNTASGGTPSWVLLSSLPSTAGILPVANGGTGLATLTTNGVVLGAGAGVPTFVTTSTAGALLESNGTTWVAAPGGVLINQQTFTSSGTYTPTVGTTKIIVQMWGGGGAGGSCTAVAGCASGGGGSGGYAEYYSSSPVSGAVTIGAGGAAVAGATGGVGTATTLVQGGTTITANGGAGGTTAAGNAVTKYTAGGAGGTISTSGTVNAAGVRGEFGSTSATATIGGTGGGGSTSLGGGGVGVVYSSAAAVAGVAAVANTGSGGSGGGTGTTSAAAGGAGAAGRVLIWEYR